MTSFTGAVPARTVGDDDCGIHARLYIQERKDIMSEGQNFTKGKILMPLVKFALPVLAAIFLQTMYGAVDMLVVGQFAQAADVSAVSTGSWLMQLITAFVVGIAMGTTILLGRKIGEGRAEEGGKIIGASIMLFIVIGVVIFLIIVLV